jgi:hypothetical protein
MFLQQFFLNALCILFILPVYCQNDWKLEKQKNGISVFTKNIQSSKFKEIKVDAVLSGKLTKMDSIIRDVKNHKQWIYHTKNAYPVKYISNNEIIYYEETAIPWPFKNRDVVIDMKLYMDTIRHTLTISSYNVDHVLPANADIVRVPFLSLDWDIKELDKNQLHIQYYFIADPGGSLSPWLANFFAVTGPYDTFSNLANLLKSNSTH